MKKVTFTVAQILFLHKVREHIGYSGAIIIDFLDDNPEPTIEVDVNLSATDIEGMADSIQQYIDREEVPEEELETANEIFGILFPEEEVVQSEGEHNADDETDDEFDDYPGPDKE